MAVGIRRPSVGCERLRRPRRERAFDPRRSRRAGGQLCAQGDDAAVDDLGIVVNEGAVHGQVHGGLAQGLGQALLEEGVYDGASGRLVPDSPMTYPLPRAADLPSITWVDNGMPSSTNALGAKACAETSASAAPPTIMNAVVDALAAYSGAEHLQMPARPEAIYRILLAPPDAGRKGPPGPV